MSWTVRVDLGPVTWTADRIDPPDRVDATAPLPALVGVSWSHELDTPDGHALPAPAAPSTATLRVLVESAAAADWVTAGLPVAVEVTRAGAQLAPPFYGRATEPTVEPHHLGALVTVSCVDYLADLAEHTVGDAAWPAETLRARLDRAFDAAGQPRVVEAVPGGGALLSSVQAVARDKQPEQLLSLTQESLAYAGFPVVADYEAGRGVAWWPHLAAGIDPATRRLSVSAPWVVEWHRPDLVTAPAVLRLDQAGAVVLVDQPPVDDGALPAAVVDRAATWSRSHAGIVNNVVLVGADKEVARARRRGAGERTVTRRVETPLSAAPGTTSSALALALLPEREGPAGWVADGFTVYADHDPGLVVPGLRAGVAVVGIDPRHNPAGTGWQLGVLRAVAVEVAAGSCRVDVTVDPHPAPAPGPAAITWQQLDPTLTWQQLDPTLTWRDAAATRGTTP